MLSENRYVEGCTYLEVDHDFRKESELALHAPYVECEVEYKAWGNHVTDTLCREDGECDQAFRERVEEMIARVENREEAYINGYSIDIDTAEPYFKNTFTHDPSICSKTLTYEFSCYDRYVRDGNEIFLR